jgi:hypothetical protein
MGSPRMPTERVFTLAIGVHTTLVAIGTVTEANAAVITARHVYTRKAFY